MTLDWLYIFGLLIVWWGNFAQIQKIIKTKSTKSLSLTWLLCLTVSIIIRIPRAVTSTYWAWSISYVISLVIMLIFLGVVIYYRRKYPKK